MLDVIKTAFTYLLGIEHPIAQAGMGGFTSPELVAAVSNAGGLGILGASDYEATTIHELVGTIRERTKRPFGINLLLHGADDELMRAVLEARPAVLSTAWPRDDQNLAAIFESAHERGINVLHMVPTLADAGRAAEAGADVIIAQGTDGAVTSAWWEPRSSCPWSRVKSHPFLSWRPAESRMAQDSRRCLRWAPRVCW